MTSILEKPVLLLGASGMLGRAWQQVLSDRGEPFVIPTKREVDFTQPATLAGLDARQYSAVINCVAYTDVDAAEGDEPGATLVNGDAVGALAGACRDGDAALVHYSTDYVFPGRASAPYAVDHPRAPINAYGRSKLRGEELLQASGCRHLLVRTSWLYASWGKNFVLTIDRAAAAREELRVVDDQRGRPTSSAQLAKSTLALLERGAHGTFHICDGGECTWFDFAARIVAHRHYPCRVMPCSSDEYVRPARRPAYSVMDLSALEQVLGPPRGWEQNLDAVLNELPPAATVPAVP